MLNLPKELQQLIFEYDNTYKVIFNNVLKYIPDQCKKLKNYIKCDVCNCYVKNRYKHENTLKHAKNKIKNGYISLCQRIIIRSIFMDYNISIYIRKYEFVYLVDNILENKNIEMNDLYSNYMSTYAIYLDIKKNGCNSLHFHGIFDS
jgi:hypothetical protein